MTGHVRWDKETKSWMYTIEIGRGGNRKRRVKKNFKKQREAKEAMNLAVAELQQTESVVDHDITLGEYLDYWLRNYAKTNTAPNTYKGYEKIVRVHIKPSLGKTKLAELKTKYVQEYYTEKLGLHEFADEEDTVLSAQTVKHHHRLLTKALNDAIDWEFISKNVATKAKPPKPERYKIITYSVDELNKLFEKAKASKVHYPIIFTATETGARLGELRAVTWNDIDLDNRRIYITKTAYDAEGGGVGIKDLTKNGRDRYVTMGKRLTAFLKEHKEKYLETKKILGKSFNPLDLVFNNTKGNYFDPRELLKSLKKAYRRAGLKVGRFHDLRHSHATLLLQKNVHPKVVSERLGHSKIGITVDLYSHVVPSLQDGAVEVFDDMFD
ncbi:tyrosine-type recombinase/integrase [Aquibacillus sediminis]|uniref:tyrosine-type recombinase/integrase n=1 Tax=Aquibacillus sediminis TaxID=2574734 RepID=UPI001109185A|nr:site-specific integrase [Aquibacillus sediminis]